MRRILLVMTLVVAQRALAAEKGPFARLELRGELRASEARGDGLTGHAVRVNDLTIELALTGAAGDAPARLRDAAGKTVLASGALEVRRRAGGQAVNVCVVKADDLIVVGARYLVGYREGDGGPVATVARNESLKVVENYRPGKYLVVEVTGDAHPSVISRLKAAPDVRYVEPDATRRIED